MKEIMLSQGMVALVDDEDYDRLNKFKWHIRTSGNNISARRWVTQGNAMLMHREIMGLDKDNKMVVDHKDHNALNNQKSNLRVCTQQQNAFNKTPRGKSKYLGVFWSPKIKRWCVQIKIDGKPKHIGCFLKENEEDAARCYDEKAKSLHGEFANLNFKQ